MKRGTIIIIVFIVIVALLVGANLFLRTQPALEVHIAVSPLAEAWVRDAAASYNATQPTVNTTRRVQIVVEQVEDTSVWLASSNVWTESAHPDGWVAAAAWSFDAARAARLPLNTVQPSLARTLLVWGGFDFSVEDLNAPLDWEGVQAAASGNIALAFPDPSRTVTGLAALLSGAAALADTPDLTGAQVNSVAFHDWIAPVLDSVPNFNTFGDSVAAAMAARGPSIGAIALLPESEWLLNARSQLATSLRLNYPAYTVTFDFPLAGWSGTASASTPAQDVADRAAAVAAFGDYLLAAAQQTNAGRFGLRPADADIAPGGSLFTNAAPVGAQPEPATIPISFSRISRDDLRSLANWVAQVVP